jgi:acetyl-CoA decarbonylase/synthase complex subunit gamma
LPGSEVEHPRLDQSFVVGAIDTPTGQVPVVSAELTRADRFGGYRVRWGIGRYTYTVDPGLYAIGAPNDRSPVLVSANYKLSFDALRRTLVGRDVWVLVLDTRGINVWCAAGKGTFGTDEVVRRIEAADLTFIVSHNVVVLPQLGAPGVSAPEVRRLTRFRVVYGPVRATDLPAFLDAGMQATPEMRRVAFPMRDRLVLTPVEVVNELRIALAVLAGTALVAGFGPGFFSLTRAWHAVVPMAVVVVATLLSGGLFAPLLLPWLPGRMFALKGAEIGALTALAVIVPLASAFSPLRLAAVALFMIAGSSFIAMNFTGTSTFTSLHGVEKEMRAAMPLQIVAVVLAAGLWIAKGFLG